ncbi:hypothetical protein Tdes44962_MAKER09566 [Teratosphaeria destructans]|uniref:Uncharacterized protein n=1 Tax=Teratosphaeria destructans TaxID=418781 RepID=A0A9W7W2Y9_9PEZI|nr:hypothetical protein Tdes44962_MAKER09566 [Teratosphaeria destructans]
MSSPDPAAIAAYKSLLTDYISCPDPATSPAKSALREQCQRVKEDLLRRGVATRAELRRLFDVCLRGVEDARVVESATGSARGGSDGEAGERPGWVRRERRESSPMGWGREFAELLRRRQEEERAAEERAADPDDGGGEQGRDVEHRSVGGMEGKESAVERASEGGSAARRASRGRGSIAGRASEGRGSLAGQAMSDAGHGGDAPTPSLQQPTRTPSVHQATSRTPSIHQPTRTPSIHQSTRTPSVHQPISDKPSSHQPTRTSSIHQPTRTPAFHQPISDTPSIDQPTRTPSMHQPTRTPCIHHTLRTPSIHQPLHTPSIHQPLYTPSHQPRRTPRLPSSRWLLILLLALLYPILLGHPYNPALIHHHVSTLLPPIQQLDTLTLLPTRTVWDRGDRGAALCALDEVRRLFAPAQDVGLRRGCPPLDGCEGPFLVDPDTAGEVLYQLDQYEGYVGTFWDGVREEERWARAFLGNLSMTLTDVLEARYVPLPPFSSGIGQWQARLTNSLRTTHPWLHSILLHTLFHSSPHVHAIEASTHHAITTLTTTTPNRTNTDTPSSLLPSFPTLRTQCLASLNHTRALLLSHPLDLSAYNLATYLDHRLPPACDVSPAPFTEMRALARTIEARLDELRVALGDVGFVVDGDDAVWGVWEDVREEMDGVGERWEGLVRGLRAAEGIVEGIGGR